jgi:hypothetical protein
MITHVLNMAGIGRINKVSNFVHQISQSSRKNTSHTQDDAGIDRIMERQHIETMTDTGILICSALRVPCGILMVVIMTGAAIANNVLGSRYQLP